MNTVRSERLQYTPSFFARTSLLHLSETGTLTALKPHTSARENLGGFLLFAVEQGSGMVEICNRRYYLTSGDIAFIDCSKPYSHSTPAHFGNISSTDTYGKLSDYKGETPDSDSLEREVLENGLWTISWVHFNGLNMPDIYNKFLQENLFFILLMIIFPFFEIFTMSQMVIVTSGIWSLILNFAGYLHG